MSQPNYSDQENETKRKEPKPLRDWTVMVYMAGDNNLSADCIWALTEMKKVDVAEGINIIAQFDPSDGRARTRRYEISAPDVQAHGMENGDRPLADFAVDFAHYNPRTDEVHFAHESPTANALATGRKEKRRARSKGNGRGLETGEQTSDILGTSSHDTNSASPITLYNFLSYGVHFYPARHYMVVLSAHSGGIEPSYLMKDESSGGYMSFRDLKTVFEQLKTDLEHADLPADGRAETIDILGFDSCLMSMAEVCYELRGFVDIVVGSETYTPSSGWPYLPILQKLSAGHTGDATPDQSAGNKPAGGPMDAEAIAKHIVDSYVKFYHDYSEAGVSVALSALRVEKLRDLIPKVLRLTTAMTRELRQEHPELEGTMVSAPRPFTDALVLAHWEAQSYNGEWYADLVDFCECLQKRLPEGEVSEACAEVVKFVDEELVIASAFTGADYQFSRGVSVYFPWSTVAPYLAQYKFAEKSGWGEFLAYCTNVTRRKFRKPAEPTPAEREQIRLFEKYGANFLNYERNDRQTNVLEFNKMGSDKMGSDKMIWERMGSDKMGSDKMGSDKMGSDKMGSDKSGNPIHSMRNPPLIWINAGAGAGVHIEVKAAGKT